jgi:hypothetical protein
MISVVRWQLHFALTGRMIRDGVVSQGVALRALAWVILSHAFSVKN